MLRILHLADLHLGWVPRFMSAQKAALRSEARYRVLTHAIDYACEARNGIDLVVIAGDLFETHTPDTALVGRVVADLARLPVPLVTTPGNHDEITYAASLYQRVRWPGLLVTTPHPAHVGTLQCGVHAVHVYSLAYVGGLTQTRPAIQNFPRDEAPGLHVAIFHGTLGDWGGDRSLPLDPAALAATRYDYIALGHIHRHEKHRLGATPAVYPGMVCGKSFDDPGVGHLTVVELDGGYARVVCVPIEGQVLRTVEVDVTSMRSAEELEAALLRQGGDSEMVRVRVAGSATFHIDAERLETQLADSFFHLEVIDKTIPFTDGCLRAWAADETVLGLFVRRLQTRIAEADDVRRPVLVEALQRGICAMKQSGGLR